MSRILSTLALMVVVSGCASGSGRLGRVPEQPVFFPTPPDTARIQFLFAVSSEGDVKGRTGGFMASLFDEAGDGERIIKPYGVDFHDGRIYICDSMRPGLEIIHVATQRFEAWSPRGDGTLRKPINCRIDPRDGRLYVTDTERGQIVVFDADRSYVGAFGGDDGIVPVDVTIAGDSIWAVGLRGHAIRAYDRNSWELLASFPEEVDVEAPLRQPVNVAVRDGRVYVSDLGDFNVKIYQTDGTYERTLGSYGLGIGQFSRPKGIDVDAQGRMFVVDAGFQNVQVFDEDDRLLMFFGGGYAGPGTMWLPAKIRIVEEGLELFQPYVADGYDLEYVLLVTNQYGPDRLTVYGFVSPSGTGR